MESNDKYFDQAFLTKDAYQDSQKLQARRQIYRFLNSDQSFPEWMAERLPNSLGKLLDVGCGSGFYMGKFKPSADLVAGIDISHGMAKESGAVSSLVAVADSMRLPFPSGLFDTTLCIHMLYHVADIPGAIRELRRVTKEGGRVVVVTNGFDHMRQLREDFDSAVGDILGSPHPSVLAEPRRFRMEDAGQLLGAFDEVIRHDMRAELVVIETEAVGDYLQSMRSFHEPKLAGAVEWDEVADQFLDGVARSVMKTGVYRITTHSGMFVCT